MNPPVIIPAGLKKVPPFPPVAARLLALLAHPDVKVKDVAELISSDATFTGRLLQCVNSYEFGLSYPVSDVKQAVALVGLDRTRQVTISHATAAYAKGAMRTAELRRCWQHTVATAVLSEEIAHACDAFTNVAFTAGVMHDIGRLALLVAYPKEYERVIRGAAEQSLDILDFEREEFGVDHAEAGRVLAERWGLPLDLRVIAGRHHDPSEGSELDLLRIVHVACRLAEILGYDIVQPLVKQDVDTVLAELPARARARLKKTPAELCAKIEQRILEFDSDNGDKPPQSALPVVATAGPEDLETEPESEPDPVLETIYETEVIPAGPNRAVRLTIAAAAVVVILLFVFLLWKMR
jgi:putative nucleotidyltransferase with HDIG domain